MLLSLLSCLAILALLASSALASNGHIYALSLNGTTNLANLLIADLDTFIVRAGPPLPGVRNIGQGAAVSSDGGTFYAFAIVNVAGSGEGTFLLSLSTATGEVTALTNTSTWPGSNGTHIFVEDLFAHPDGSLLALARPLGPASPPQQQLLLRIAGGAAALLGSVPEAGGDAAWDAAGSLLYEVLPGANDEDSGSLATVRTGPGAPRVVGTPLPLQAHFGFPQWSAARGALVGLSLHPGGPNGYTRNVTLLNPRTGELTDLGGLGEDYVVLEDGPKALSASGATAYFMLASGPFAEFDVVAVDVSGAAASVKESVGLCGFIGYCPEGFAFGP
jgi:hypothetical protein